MTLQTVAERAERIQADRGVTTGETALSGNRLHIDTDDKLLYARENAQFDVDVVNERANRFLSGGHEFARTITATYSAFSGDATHTVSGNAGIADIHAAATTAAPQQLTDVSAEHRGQVLDKIYAHIGYHASAAHGRLETERLQREEKRQAETHETAEGDSLPHADGKKLAHAHGHAHGHGHAHEHAHGQGHANGDAIPGAETEVAGLGEGMSTAQRGKILTKLPNAQPTTATHGSTAATTIVAAGALSTDEHATETPTTGAPAKREDRTKFASLGNSTSTATELGSDRPIEGKTESTEAKRARISAQYRNLVAQLNGNEDPSLS